MTIYGFSIVKSEYVPTFEQGGRNNLLLGVTVSKTRNRGTGKTMSKTEVRHFCRAVRLDADGDWARLDTLTNNQGIGVWALYEPYLVSDPDGEAVGELLARSTAYLDVAYLWHLKERIVRGAQYYNTGCLDEGLALPEPWVGSRDSDSRAS